MSDSQKGQRSPIFSFMPSLPSGVSATMTQVREKMASARQIVHEGMQQGTANLRSTRAAVVNHAHESMAAASKSLDRAMGEGGAFAVNLSRDKFKRQPLPDDGFIKSYKKYAHNKVVDVLADNAERISRSAQGFAEGVGAKVRPSTSDRWSPRHLATLAGNPQLAKRYLSQRMSQLRQPFDFVADPKGFAKQRMHQARNSAANGFELAQGLDAGVANKVRHGARALVDGVQEAVAPAIGAAALGFGIYNSRAQQRAGTRAAMDHTFPKRTLYGKAFRTFPARMMFAKPLSRIRGNPRLSLGLLAYGMATGIGKSIEDSQTLQRSKPNTHARLTASNREMLASSRWLAAHESVAKTSAGAKKR